MAVSEKIRVRVKGYDHKLVDLTAEKIVNAAKENGTFSLPVLFYLITYAVIMLIGVFFMKKKSKK